MWIYDDKKFNETPEDYQGFVYQITELSTGKKYIGKKNFWSPKTLPKNSKRPRKIKTRIESNWREYYGSNKELQENAKENQKDFNSLNKKFSSYFEAHFVNHFEELVDLIF